MTLDHMREIALIQISQAQRTPAMTIIDTALYANGALRLSRHGAGHGDTVLTRTWDGKSLTLADEDTAAIDQLLTAEQGTCDPEDIFHHVRECFGRF